MADESTLPSRYEETGNSLRRGLSRSSTDSLMLDDSVLIEASVSMPRWFQSVVDRILG